MTAGSVRHACQNALADGFRTGVEYEGEWIIDWTDKIESGKANPLIHSAFGYAAQMVVADPQTGKVERVVAVHDVGKVRPGQSPDFRFPYRAQIGHGAIPLLVFKP